MPSPEQSFNWQKALLWEAQGYDEYGQPTRSPTSVEIRVRWDSRQSRMLNAQGNTIAVDATATVRQDIPLGSLMWQGSQDDLEAAVTGTGTGTDLEPDSDIFEVVTFNRMPDIKARFFQLTVGLKHYRRSMATSA